MGLIADFIIATEPEAMEYARSQAGIAHSDLFESNGITCVELSTLLAVLNGKEWEDDLLDWFPTVGDDSSGLTRVGVPLLGRLTDSDYDLDQVAAAWAATEEMQWKPEEAREVIDGLARLAVRARRVDKPVYLWNCI